MKLYCNSQVVQFAVLADVCCVHRVQGRVPEYRWDMPEEREAACEMLRQHAVNNAPLPGPILLKGPAKHWPAVEKWSLDWMARQWPKLWWVAPGVHPDGLCLSTLHQLRPAAFSPLIHCSAHINSIVPIHVYLPCLERHVEHARHIAILEGHRVCPCMYWPSLCCCLAGCG